MNDINNLYTEWLLSLFSQLSSSPTHFYKEGPNYLDVNGVVGLIGRVFPVIFLIPID